MVAIRIGEDMPWHTSWFDISATGHWSMESGHAAERSEAQSPLALVVDPLFYCDGAPEPIACTWPTGSRTSSSGPLGDPLQNVQ